MGIEPKTPDTQAELDKLADHLDHAMFDERFAQQINLISIVNVGLEKKNNEALKYLRPRAAGLLALPLGRA
jgi:hypothetical protein